MRSQKERLQNEKNLIFEEKDVAINGVSALIREIEYLRKDTLADKKKIIDLIRFREVMDTTIKKAESFNEDNKKEIII